MEDEQLLDDFMTEIDVNTPLLPTRIFPRTNSASPFADEGELINEGEDEAAKKGNTKKSKAERLEK